MGFGIEELVRPVSPTAFFKNFWLQRPLVCANRNRRRFETIVSIDDVDGIAATLLHVDAARVALCRGRAFPVARRESSRVDASIVREAYRDGVTVLLTMVENVHRPIARFCRCLEDSLTGAGVLLEHPVTANLYLSPPASSGFDPHYDDHDVMILQIGGRKKWRFFGPKEPFPLHRMKGPIVPEDIPKLQKETVLRAGGFAYIPRGHFHHAQAEDCYSLHLTLAIRPWTRLSLVTRVLESAKELRQAIPVMNGNCTQLAAELACAMRSVDWNATAVSDGWRMLAEEYATKITPLPDGAIGQVARLHKLRLTTRVAHRLGANPKVCPDGDHTRLVFGNASFSSPAQLTAVFEFIARTNHFRARDLPDVLPEDGKLALVAELVRHGLLVVE